MSQVVSATAGHIHPGKKHVSAFPLSLPSGWNGVLWSAILDHMYGEMTREKPGTYITAWSRVTILSGQVRQKYIYFA